MLFSLFLQGRSADIFKILFNRMCPSWAHTQFGYCFATRPCASELYSDEVTGQASTPLYTATFWQDSDQHAAVTSYNIARLKRYSTIEDLLEGYT